MLARPDTPGVYIQPVDADRSRISALRTDVAGFVGIAERGPIGVAVLIKSMRQYESVFGTYIGGGYLAYTVRGFFENGGNMCRVVRVAAAEAHSASTRIRLADGRFGLTLLANSPGTWGNRLTARITPSRRAETMALSGGDARSTVVLATTGMARHVLVRLTQGAAEIWRIVADVNATESRIFWTHPDPSWRTDWEAPLAGISPGLPFRVECVDYDVALFERSSLVANFASLTPVQGAERFMPDVLRLPAGLLPNASTSGFGTTGFAPPPPALALIDHASGPDWGAVPILDASGSRLAFAGGVDGLSHLSATDFIAQGLDRLAAVRGVAILAVPDIHIQPVQSLLDPQIPTPFDPCEPCGLPSSIAPAAPLTGPEMPPVFDLDQIHRVQAAMIDQCERLRNRVAIIDPPYLAAKSASIGAGQIRAWRSRFDSGFGAIYHPWLSVLDPRSRNGVRAVPPSGHVAGQYAAMDQTIGVHRVAADLPVVWALAATLAVDANTHGLLNTDGINVIKAREGRLLRSLGARTMSSDPTWRFIPVRRLVCMLRETLDVATQWAVFEPNNETTRLLLQDSMSAFLDQIWKKGALAGAIREEAYQVRCDDVNNDATVRENGRLHIDVAIAPAVPLEFIILRIRRQANSFELIEDGARRASFVGGAH